MHKKKSKILVIGTSPSYSGDAGAGKSSLIQTYVKKNYQFSSDYVMVPLPLFRLKALKFTPKSSHSLSLTLT
jgi:hypothetical protein